MSKSPQQHYVHHLKYSTQERLVGVFVLSAIAILIILLFISGDTLRLFEGRVKYIAYMHNAVGVSTNTKIRISGIEVGAVHRISLNPADNRFKVVLSVYKDFQSLVRTDSRASINRLAFIGDSVINVTSGSNSQPQLPNGGVIEVDELLSVDELIAHLKPALDKINNSINKIAGIMDALPSGSLGKLLNNAAEASGHLNQVTQEIASGQGTVGAIIKERKLYSNLNQSLAILETTLNNINETAQQTRLAAESMPVTLKALAETAAIIRAESASIPELAADTRQLLDDTQQVINALRYTWPISSKIKDKADPSIVLPLQPSHD